MAARGIVGVALITGAGSGIGQEAAFGFAEAGAIGVVFADLDEKAAEASAEKSKTFAANPKYRAVAVKVDVTDPGSVQTMVDTTIKEFGRVDYNVNCAGVGVKSTRTMSEAAMQEYDFLMDVNVKGTVLCMGAVTAAMEKQEPLTYEGRNGKRSIGRGAIVNMSSMNGMIAELGKGPYVASKFAVMGITKTAALENIPKGIRVNAMCPGWVDTPMMAEFLDILPPLRQRINRASPMKRMAFPEEIGDIIVFLCSPSASYVNGIGLLADGGLTLGTVT